MLCHGASSMVASMPGMLGSGGGAVVTPETQLRCRWREGHPPSGMWDGLLGVAASVKGGHAIAALVVGKLCSSRRQQNALAAAIKEYSALRHRALKIPAIDLWRLFLAATWRL